MDNNQDVRRPQLVDSIWKIYIQRKHTYPAWYKKLLKMTIEIVDLPIENGDFP